jgi:hypothetical protein
VRIDLHADEVLPKKRPQFLYVFKNKHTKRNSNPEKKTRFRHSALNKKPEISSDLNRISDLNDVWN